MKQLIKIIQEITTIKSNSNYVEAEKRVAQYLINFLKKEKISFKEQLFTNFAPMVKKIWLKVDNKKINCENGGLKSGKIDSKNNLVSLLADLQSFDFQSKKGIGFNPWADVISLARFSQGCLWVISRKDLVKVVFGEKIKGEVVVEKKQYLSRNILVGNLKNPQKIIFSHFDSIKRGVVDNTCAVALLLDLILKNQKIIQDNLLVFSGAEELSYEWPVYWGKGFRVFERKYFDLLKKAKSIIVFDSVGNGLPREVKEKEMIFEGFPLKNFSLFLPKIKMISGDLDLLMKYYHSDEDDLDKIKSSFLKHTQRFLIEKVN